jgi:hypothetical protein
MALLGMGGLAIGTRAGAAEPRVIVSKVQLRGSRVVMALTIGGQGPFDFLLDTGGFLSFIDADFAERLKMQITGQTAAQGIGGRAVLPVYLAHDVVFGGGARQTSVAFAGLERGAFGFGRDVHGAVAAGFLTAIDSDLDFEAGEWRAYPDGRPPRDGYVQMKNAIVAGGTGPRAGSRRLFGDAAIDGRDGRFLLDTGAPGGMTVDNAFAKRVGLWDDTRPWAPARPSGIGGAAGIARVVRANSLDFAGTRTARPLVTLRAVGDGIASGQNGIIGLGLLRRFNLSTDTKTRDLWLKEHRSAATVQERYGMSGLWLDRGGDDRWKVAAVGTGSPAAAAGIAVGDVVAAADGSDVLRQIGGRPGATAQLTVSRGSAPARPVALTLTPYL